MATDTEKVRLLIHDQAGALFTAPEILTFLEMETDVYGAAALALESMAANKALIAKSMSSGQFSVSLSEIPKVLLDAATRYRERSAALYGSGVPATAVVENDVYPWETNMNEDT